MYNWYIQSIAVKNNQRIVRTNLLTYKMSCIINNAILYLFTCVSNWKHSQNWDIQRLKENKHVYCCLLSILTTQSFKIQWSIKGNGRQYKSLITSCRYSYIQQHRCANYKTLCSNDSQHPSSVTKKIPLFILVIIIFPLVIANSFIDKRKCIVQWTR